MPINNRQFMIRQKKDLELICTLCKHVLCDVTNGDPLAVLNYLAEHHACMDED